MSTIANDIFGMVINMWLRSIKSVYSVKAWSYRMSCELYNVLHKLETMVCYYPEKESWLWKSKSSRLSYNLFCTFIICIYTQYQIQIEFFSFPEYAHGIFRWGTVAARCTRGNRPHHVKLLVVVFFLYFEGEYDGNITTSMTISVSTGKCPLCSPYHAYEGRKD